MSPPPRTTTIGPQVSGDLFLVVTLLSNNCHTVSVVFLSAWPLYIALSNLILPLCQPIRPFTTNKALYGPSLHHDRALFSPCPPSGWGVRGWSAPALPERLSCVFTTRCYTNPIYLALPSKFGIVLSAPL